LGHFTATPCSDTATLILESFPETPDSRFFAKCPSYCLHSVRVQQKFANEQDGTKKECSLWWQAGAPKF
jgi:hypothetical protein